jgi:hypothetical protein
MLSVFTIICSSREFRHGSHNIVDGYARFLHRYVNTRWIEIGPVIERVGEQWCVINEYFLACLPASDKSLGRNEHCKPIKVMHQNKVMIVHLEFVLYLYCTIF